MMEPVVIAYHDRPSFVLMTMQEYDQLRGRRRQVGAVTQLSESVALQIEALAQIENEPTQEMAP